MACNGICRCPDALLRLTVWVVGDDTLLATSKIATLTRALPPIIGRGLEVDRHLTRAAFWAAEPVGQAPNREITPPSPQQRFHVEVDAGDAGADALHPVTLAVGAAGLDLLAVVVGLVQGRHHRRRVAALSRQNNP